LTSTSTIKARLNPLFLPLQFSERALIYRKNFTLPKLKENGLKVAKILFYFPMKVKKVDLNVWMFNRLK